MTPQEAFWSGDQGNAYVTRNRVDWRARIPFWADIMLYTGARSVYEFGCGSGWNLSAIREAAGFHVELYGSDLNELAAWQARTAGLNIPFDASIQAPVELAFTCGVLIHIAPDSLETTMRTLINVSTDYVLAVEYASDDEEMVEYRGESERLWKRPYGKLYQDLGLILLHTGYLARPAFDNCTYWLMRKP